MTSADVTADAELDEVVVGVASDADVVTARMQGRVLAQRLGLGPTEVALVTTAISEIARNIVQHAGRGTVRLSLIARTGRQGLCVVAMDAGPGIADVDQALQDGFSTGGGLGLGLPGARRLVDEFELTSAPGQGTTVRLVTWSA